MTRLQARPTDEQYREAAKKIVGRSGDVGGLGPGEATVGVWAAVLPVEDGAYVDVTVFVPMSDAAREQRG